MKDFLLRRGFCEVRENEYERPADKHSPRLVCSILPHAQGVCLYSCVATLLTASGTMAVFSLESIIKTMLPIGCHREKRPRNRKHAPLNKEALARAASMLHILPSSVYRGVISDKGHEYIKTAYEMALQQVETPNAVPA